MNQRLKNKLNQKGATLVFVLVTFAIVTILTTLVLMSTLMNIKMKAINANAKNSFYSCEKALSEIKAGLQEQVSSAFTDSYVDVMQNYINFGTDNTLTKDNASANERRQAMFEYEYLTALRNSLKAGTADTTHYNVSELQKYITQPYSSATGTGAKVDAAVNTAGVTMNLLTHVDKGLALKNLVVKYTDSKGNVSQVRTDILLEYPDIEFTQTTDMPDLLNFTLVAQRGLNCVTSGEINGSLYAGTDASADGYVNTNEDGIRIANGSVLTIENANTAIVDPAVNVSSNARFVTKVITADDNMNLWTAGINITSANVNISGSTYIADDLTVDDDTGIPSTVAVSGDYYGYRNHVTAVDAKSANKEDIKNNPSSYDSAIIVNGTNVSMDFSGINYLLLSGNAYIGAKNVNSQLTDASYKNQNNIMTGESLTVKSNQLAYLVPAKLIGKGIVGGGENPMTKENYLQLLDNAKNAGKEIIDAKDIVDIQAQSYETVFYPYLDTTVVYFYLTFQNDKQASAYFQNYYKTNVANIDKYIKFYINNITAPGSSVKFDLNGSILESVSGDDVTLKPDTIENNDGTANGGTNTSAALKTRQNNLQDKYAAYCANLTSNYLSVYNSGKINNKVFDNLVKTDAITESLKKTSNGYIAFTTEKTFLQGIVTEDDVVITKGSSGISRSYKDGKYTLTISTGEGKETSPALRAVVTTGNVTLENSCVFNGLIVSDGLVTMNDAKAISAPEDVAKVLETTTNVGGESVKFMKYLVDAENYIIGGAANGTVNGQSTTDVENLVVYQNWVKQ